MAILIFKSFLYIGIHPLMSDDRPFSFSAWGLDSVCMNMKVVLGLRGCMVSVFQRRLVFRLVEQIDKFKDSGCNKGG